MAMRMTGIEVICGDPVEPRAKIDFHLPHQVADKRFEVGEFGGVLRRHDEAELVAVAFAVLDECLTVGSIAARIVKLAGSPLARDAIALHVFQMRPHALVSPALMRTIRVLMTTRRWPAGWRLADTLRIAAADARAGEIGSPLRSPFTDFVRDLADAFDVADRLATAAVANPAKPDPEFILAVRHGRSPSTAHPCGAHFRCVKTATRFVNVARRLIETWRQRSQLGANSWMCRQRLRRILAPVLLSCSPTSLSRPWTSFQEMAS